MQTCVETTIHPDHHQFRSLGGRLSSTPLSSAIGAAIVPGRTLLRADTVDPLGRERDGQVELVPYLCVMPAKAYSRSQWTLMGPSARESLGCALS